MLMHGGPWNAPIGAKNPDDGHLQFWGGDFVHMGVAQ